jgi:hypothetical protein
VCDGGENIFALQGFWGAVAVDSMSTLPDFTPCAFGFCCPLAEQCPWNASCQYDRPLSALRTVLLAHHDVSVVPYRAVPGLVVPVIFAATVQMATRRRLAGRAGVLPTRRALQADGWLC